MKYSLGIRTETGPKSHNEDRILTAVSEEDPNAVLLIVSDGMGGANAGEVASQKTVDLLHTYLMKRELPRSDEITSILTNAIQEANRVVYVQGKSAPEMEGMGCTVVTAFVLDDAFWVAHVGDSRAYLIRAGQVQQLTRDHSWVESQIRQGKLSAEAAQHLQLGHVLDRALGADESVEVDVWEDDILEEGDVLILCSDGLSGVVSEAALITALEDRSAMEAADYLMEAALNAPATDNVSVIVFRVEET
jgi:protein phosphatase